MKWRKEVGPTDMWIREELIPTTKRVISVGDFQGWYMWHGSPSHTEEQRKEMREKWVNEKAHLLDFERVLDLVGCSGTRSVTVIGTGPLAGRWVADKMKRKKSNK